MSHHSDPSAKFYMNSKFIFCHSSSVESVFDWQVWVTKPKKMTSIELVLDTHAAPMQKRLQLFLKTLKNESVSPSSIKSANNLTQNGSSRWKIHHYQIQVSTYRKFFIEIRDLTSCSNINARFCREFQHSNTTPQQAGNSAHRVLLRTTTK